MQHAGGFASVTGRMKQIFQLSTHLLLVPVPAASLYPFGAEEGDRECVQRTVDFSCPLLMPEIGFPFGKSLRDVLYVSCPLAEH